LKETAMRRRTSAPVAPIAALILVAGLTVAGCSHLGGLHHGAPAAKGAAAPPAQARQQTNPNHPTQTIDPRDASGTPAPPRTLPIPGTAPSPTAVAPPGALPDPYANPPR
jgi:hypothetical protein